MRIPLDQIRQSTFAFQQAIAARDSYESIRIGELVLANLPANDWADPAPGVTLCYGEDEYVMAAVIPMLRASVQRWLQWLESPSGPWPEAKVLSQCVAMMNSLENAD